jgi:hypothetical protein
MKRLMAVAAAMALSGALTGCAYGGVAAVGDKVVIAKNDGFLFGLLRGVYVCKVTDAGVTDCRSADAP